MDDTAAGGRQTGVSTTDVDDQFRSLLEGLRTTLPGIQIITAFLLTLPLYDRFDEFSTAERWAYFVAFVSALASSILLMAPSAHQRLRSDERGVRRHSRRHLASAVRLTVGGTVGLAVALGAVAYLVSSLVMGTAVAAALTTVLGVLALWSWFYLPVVAFEDDDDQR